MFLFVLYIYGVLFQTYLTLAKWQTQVSLFCLMENASGQVICALSDNTNCLVELKTRNYSFRIKQMLIISLAISY